MIRTLWHVFWTISLAARLSTGAIGLACLATVLQSVTPLYVFISLIMASMACTSAGIIVAQRKAKRLELEAKMEKAFGKPNDRPE